MATLTGAPARPGSAGPVSSARAERDRREALRDLARSWLTGVRLGWRIESNWADPLVFLIYSVARPVASVLILVAMLEIVSGGQAPTSARTFLVVGSALWVFVTSGIAGIPQSVLDDRERYRMLRYLAVLPATLIVVLMGRGTARMLIGAMGAAITLALAAVLLGLGFDPATADWALALAAMLLGLVAIVALGIAMAGICLQTRQDSWNYPEAVAGALFLLTGAVFPLSVLPLPAQAVGLAMPLTWWLEGVRRGLFPSVASAVGGPGSLWTQLTGTAVPGPDAVLGALSLLAPASIVLAAVVYRWSEGRARDRGLLDQVTGS